MSKPVRRLSRSRATRFKDQHRFEHWLVDNQVYFITARCRDKFPSFETEEAKAIETKRLFGLTQKDGRLDKVRQIGRGPQRAVSFAPGPHGELYLLGYEGTIYEIDFSPTRFE